MRPFEGDRKPIFLCRIIHEDFPGGGVSKISDTNLELFMQYNNARLFVKISSTDLCHSEEAQTWNYKDKRKKNVFPTSYLPRTRVYQTLPANADPMLTIG